MDVRMIKCVFRALVGPKSPALQVRIPSEVVSHNKCIPTYVLIEVPTAPAAWHNVSQQQWCNVAP